MDTTPHKIIDIPTGTVVKVIVISLLFYALFLLKNLVLLVLMAVVIASAVEMFTKWFTRQGVPRLLAVILIYLSTAVLIVGTVYFILLPLLSESSAVVKTLPLYLSSESAQTSDFLSNQPFVSGLTSTINFQSVAEQINVMITNLSSGTFNTVAGVFGGILSSVLIVVLSFYLSVKEDGIHNFLKIVTPIKHEAYALNLWKRAQHKIGLWMQGQIVLAVIIGVLVFLGLTLMSIPNALLLAFLAAVFEIIPLFGPILASIPAIALSFVDGGITSVFLVACLYLIIHQFENHLIYPLVVKKITGVSPVVSIIALVAGFELAGFLGLVLSVPLATICIEFLDDLERDKIAKMESMNA